MRFSKIEIFKRPKNRRDGSIFDDFRTKKIAATRAVSWKKIRTNETNKKFAKNSKKYQNLFRQILKIDIADVINY